MQCEMCGKENAMIRSYIVEGVTLQVCPACGQFGTRAPNKQTNTNVSGHKLSSSKRVFSLKEMEPTETIVDNYDVLIRNKRFKLHMTQEEFAKKIAEKESVIHALETGKHEPSMMLAKKIEKILEIKLIEKEVKTDEDVLKEFRNTNKSQHMTLGDMITIKRRK